MREVQVPEMPHKRGSHMSAAVGDSLYVTGGWDSENYLDHLEVYDTRAGRWRCAPPMTTARAYGSTAVLDDQIYVMGGLDGSVGLLTTHAVSVSSSIYSCLVHSVSLSYQAVEYLSACCCCAASLQALVMLGALFSTSS